MGWTRLDDTRNDPAELTEWPEFTGFRYPTPSTDVLKEEFCEAIPPDKREWARFLATGTPRVNEILPHRSTASDTGRRFIPD